MSVNCPIAPLMSNLRALRYRLQTTSAQAGAFQVAQHEQQCGIIVSGFAIDSIGRPPSSFLQLSLELVEFTFLDRGEMV